MLLRQKKEDPRKGLPVMIAIMNAYLSIFSFLSAEVASLKEIA